MNLSTNVVKNQNTRALTYNQHTHPINTGETRGAVELQGADQYLLWQM